MISFMFWPIYIPWEPVTLLTELFYLTVLVITLMYAICHVSIYVQVGPLLTVHGQQKTVTKQTINFRH